MNMEGWIKLHRKSLSHWLYNESRPHTRREAWEDMLLLCNHDDEKVLIQGEIIDCKRGQSVMSLKSWAKQFKWTIQKVRTFFILLENDSMIVSEGLRKSTRITICNYEIYQNNQHADNKEITRKQQGDNKEITTNKNEKNEKNNIYTWRDDFELYKKELRKVYFELIEDKEYIKLQEKYHPKVDIKLSIEKACTNYWATEVGWKKKKASKTNEIDWKATLTNAINLNKVYKT